MADHLSSRLLFRSDHLSIGEVHCRSPRCGCTPAEQSSRHSLAFVRSGVFVKHIGREQVVADATRVVFFSPAQPYRVSHPIEGGDVCVTLAPAHEWVREALQSLDPAAADTDDAALTVPDAPADPQSFLWQSRVVRALEQGRASRLAVEEAACLMIGRLFAAAYRSRGLRAGQRGSTLAAHRDLVSVARLVLRRGPCKQPSLGDLADKVHSSPYHLSRVFHRLTGLTLQRYLNRVRLREALARVADGEDLTKVALASGFYDHSHFTNAFRREFGVPPSAVRREALAQMSNAFQV